MKAKRLTLGSILLFLSALPMIGADHEVPQDGCPPAQCYEGYHSVCHKECDPNVSPICSPKCVCQCVPDAVSQNGGKSILNASVSDCRSNQPFSNMNLQLLNGQNNWNHLED
jgi:hypothetical protein